MNELITHVPPLQTIVQLLTEGPVFPGLFQSKTIKSIKLSKHIKGTLRLKTFRINPHCIYTKRLCLAVSLMIKSIKFNKHIKITLKQNTFHINHHCIYKKKAVFSCLTNDISHQIIWAEFSCFSLNSDILLAYVKHLINSNRYLWMYWYHK